ncbi:hypothetical protein BSZ35_14365 [Salinibacter sp. 10B]|nr:hypothetical protein BSZ35_14365 [Salinibacter sp. 10B]
MRSFEKTAFVLSLVILSFLYGYATRWHGWFPNKILEQASQKITALSSAWSPASALVQPRVYDREGVKVVEPDAVQSGLTLLVSSWEGADGLKPELRLINEHGRALHKWRIDRGSLFPDSALGLRGGSPSRAVIHGSHLFPNGDVIVNLEYIGTARLDACGRVQWTLTEGNHHSVARGADGSFWIPGASQKLRATSPGHPEGFPGLDDPLYLEWILNVSGEGVLLNKISVLDVLYANGLERYLSKVSQPEAGTEGLRKNDVMHLNDVEPLSPALAEEYPLFEAGDLLVSLRNLHLVFVMDPESKEVKWHASAPFIQQHDPDFIGEGWIGVFDNNEDFTQRGTMLGGSRIVALQPHTDSMEVRVPKSSTEHFYTAIWGKWQHLENGNMLLTEASAGRVVEVAPDGRTVWEWVHSPFTDSKVPVVTEATRYDLSREDIADWSCSSVEPASTEQR